MKLKFPKWAAVSKLTHHHYPLTHKANAYCVWFTVTVVHGNIQSCCHVGVLTWWKQADLSVPVFALVERGHGGAPPSPWIFWNSPIKVCAIHHWKMNLQPQPLKTEAFLKKIILILQTAITICVSLVKHGKIMGCSLCLF